MLLVFNKLFAKQDLSPLRRRFPLWTSSGRGLDSHIYSIGSLVTSSEVWADSAFGVGDCRFSNYVKEEVDPSLSCGELCQEVVLAPSSVGLGRHARGVFLAAASIRTKRRGWPKKTMSGVAEDSSLSLKAKCGRKPQAACVSSSRSDSFVSSSY